jgi:hypothetical protein
LPHESVLDSLASTFNRLVPEGDDSDSNRSQSAYFGVQHGRRPPPDWVVTEAASAAGIVPANCGAIDAMVAPLINVESLDLEARDRLLGSVAQPERAPMSPVAS